MRITFAQKEFADKKVNKHMAGHFLLDQAVLEVTVVFGDSTKKVFKPARGSDGKYILVLDPIDIPDAPASGGTHKKILRSMSMDFIVDFTHGKTFRLLRIVQEFSLQALPTNSDQNIDYLLSAASWRHSPTPEKQTANANVHPMLDLGKLSQNVIAMNTLVLDLTDLWDFFHEDNKFYRVYKDLTKPGAVRFKVFAHLGGKPFIWYGIVPSYLAKSSKVSPHVFYFPSDYAEKQNIRDEHDYLMDNWKEFQAGEGSDTTFNGATLILGYLLPPIDDDRIPTLNPKFVSKTKLLAAAPFFRNVVTFGYTDKKSKRITTNHWSIPAGLERAFYGLGDVKPQQFLLMPQFFGDNGLGKERGTERDAHLTNVTDTIFDLLQTNTDLLSSGNASTLVEKDKLILSSYSESGPDMWVSSTINGDFTKAIIGIEPNSAQKMGKDVIPGLLKKKIRVFIIGRHRGWNEFYRPQIGEKLLKEVRFLPDNPIKILKYPPDPDSNNFVKFRVARVTDKNLDPFMFQDEKDILDDLAKRRKPVTGKATIPFIFTDIGNSDKLGAGGSVTAIFYDHNFALTGGQEMTLADPDKFYGKPVSYRTFFQQAVEEIG